ncbi:hypothetical protein ACVMB0_007493 [Bradyrhizobium sp. USDA 4451]
MADRKTWRPIISSYPIPATGLTSCCRTHPSELHPVTCAACNAEHFIDAQIGTMLGPSAANLNAIKPIPASYRSRTDTPPDSQDHARGHQDSRPYADPVGRGDFRPTEDIRHDRPGRQMSRCGTLAGTAVHSSCCPTVINTNRRWLELVRFDSTGSRELFRSPNSSVGDRITSQHDPIGGATRQSIWIATGVIETMRRFGEVRPSLLGQRPSDLALSIGRLPIFVSQRR